MKNPKEVVEKQILQWLKGILAEYLAYNPLMKDDGDYVTEKEIIDWIKSQPL